MGEQVLDVELLVFEHMDIDAGIQIPAGTVEESEDVSIAGVICHLEAELGPRRIRFAWSRHSPRVKLRQRPHCDEAAVRLRHNPTCRAQLFLDTRYPDVSRPRDHGTGSAVEQQSLRDQRGSGQEVLRRPQSSRHAC